MTSKLTLLVLLPSLSGSCGGSTESPGPTAAAVALTELPRPTGAQTIECGREGSYVAEFIPGSAANPVDSVQVVFSRTLPTSNEAETALRRCIEVASKTIRIDYDTLVNAWFNEDGPLPLNDGSRHLAYYPLTHEVRTWNEREP